MTDSTASQRFTRTRALIAILIGLALAVAFLGWNDRRAEVDRRHETCEAIVDLREGILDAFRTAGADLDDPQTRRAVAQLRDDTACDR